MTARQLAVPTPSSQPSFGDLLRDWRRRRNLSQLALALESDISQRHISFVESGRARPSREMVLRLAEHLEVPLRERNRLLLAAGFAPVYQERPFGDPALAALLDELRTLPAPRGHEHRPSSIATDGAGVFVPLRLASDDGVLTFLGTTMVFGTAVDVTLSELALECFFPADAETERALRDEARRG